MERLKRFIESRPIQMFIATIIVLNAIVLGLMTSKTIGATELYLLEMVDHACLVIFVVELVIKLIVYNKRFVYDSWNIFDFVVVVGSIVLISSSFSVLRAFRIFRILKVISEFPELRVLVAAMLKTIPSMTWALVLLVIIFYIFAVFGNALYGEAFPELYGDIGGSMFTLFQVMTFESWATAVARPIMAQFSYAWIYFFVFILLTSITVLNVMVGIVVDAVSQISEAENKKRLAENSTGSDEVDLEREIQEIRDHLDNLETLLTAIKEKKK